MISIHVKGFSPEAADDLSIAGIWDTDKESVANAKIMAASKELLGALEMAQRHIKIFTAPSYINSELDVVLKTAINRAL